jgi:hypothetical protein
MAHEVYLWPVMPDPTQPDEEPLTSRYSNCFRIGFNAYEFIFDFGQHHLPEKEHMHTRIVTSPTYAERFSALLQESMGDHASKYSPPENGEEP